MSYLVDAYKTIENASHRDDLPDALESAVAIIYLFGTDKQMDLANNFVGELANNGKTSADELLSDLRNHLRKELKLKSCGSKIYHLRISNKS